MQSHFYLLCFRNLEVLLQHSVQLCMCVNAFNLHQFFMQLFFSLFESPSQTKNSPQKITSSSSKSIEENIKTKIIMSKRNFM